MIPKVDQAVSFSDTSPSPISGVPRGVVRAIYDATVADAATPPPAIERLKSCKITPRNKLTLPHRPCVQELVQLVSALVDVGFSKDMKNKIDDARKMYEKIITQLFVSGPSGSLSPLFNAVFKEAHALLEGCEQKPYCQVTMQLQLQKTISYLMKLRESDETLDDSLAGIIDTLLGNSDDTVKIFVANEIQLCKDDPFYELPTKPRSEDGKLRYEAMLQQMAESCLVDSGEELLKCGVISSSGVYIIRVRDRALFIFKPCDEESDKSEKGRFPKGEGAMREYLSCRDHKKCALVTLKERNGFLIEYYRDSIGSIDYLHNDLEGLFASLSMDDVKKSKFVELGFGDSSKKISQLPIWNNAELNRKKMQDMMLRSMWNGDTDQNQGNYLVRAVELGSEFRVKDIVNIDQGRAFPSTPYTDKMRIWTPGWIDCQAAHAPIEDELKELYGTCELMEEVQYIKSQLASMTDEGAVFLLLMRSYIQVGIQNGYNLHEIAQGFIDNKVYEIINTKTAGGVPLTLAVCGKRTLIAYRNKFLEYYRQLTSSSPKPV